MLRRGSALRTPSLLALSEWQEKEAKNQLQARHIAMLLRRGMLSRPAAAHRARPLCRRFRAQSAVDEDGSLLDNLTLELRVHPPTIDIDNGAHDRWTTVTIDSANRPGSLIYVSGQKAGCQLLPLGVRAACPLAARCCDGLHCCPGMIIIAAHVARHADCATLHRA